MKKKLIALVDSLTTEEAKWFRRWILDGAREIGVEHKDTCLLNVPHSHSGDCTCEADEIERKILEKLK